MPYIRGGAGPREAVVFPGANALFRPLDQTAGPGRFARQIARLLPRHHFTILGYSEGGFDRIVPNMAEAIRKAPDMVLGISLGGMVAMHFAARHPELTRRLVILISAHRFSQSGEHIMERQFRALEQGDLPTLVRENVLQFRRPWFNWLVRLKLWQEGNRLYRGLRDPAAILSDYRELFGPDFQNNAEYCRRIASPTIVIGGTADRMFVRLIEKETHMLPVECGGAVAALAASQLSANGVQ